jgi:hypothetical protein
MGGGSGDEGASKGAQLGAGRQVLVRGDPPSPEVTQMQWMAVTQMMRLTANPNQLVVDTHGVHTTSC